MQPKPKLLNYGLSLLTAGAALLSVTSSVQAADKNTGVTDSFQTRLQWIY